MLAVVCALAVWQSGPAHADDEPLDASMEEAQALFAEGVRLFKLGEFQKACSALEKSVAMVAGLGNRGKLAECWERIGRTASAYRLYQEVERLARNADDEVRVHAARDRAQNLAARLSHLTISPGPSVTLRGFAVTRNTLPVEPRNFGIREAVDPGEYVILATAPGHEAWTARLRIAESVDRVVEVPALTPLRSPDAHRSDPPPVRPERGVRVGRIIGIGLVATGVAMLGTTAWLGLSARGLRDDALASGSDCDRVDGQIQCRANSPGEDLVRRSQSRATLTNIAAGLSLVTVAAGVLVWWRSGDAEAPTDENDDARASRSVRLEPTLAPGRIGLLVLGRF